GRGSGLKSSDSLVGFFAFFAEVSLRPLRLKGVALADAKIKLFNRKGRKGNSTKDAKTRFELLKEKSSCGCSVAFSQPPLPCPDFRASHPAGCTQPLPTNPCRPGLDPLRSHRGVRPEDRQCGADRPQRPGEQR